MNKEIEKCSGLVSAALRHLRDAQHLLNPGEYFSLEQAYHLVGYAPECARKACLYIRWGDKALGHDFGEIGEELLETLLSLDVRASRYVPRDWGTVYPALRKWNVDSRYWRTGLADQRTTEALVEQCEEAVMSIVSAMWADGVLDKRSPE